MYNQTHAARMAHFSGLAAKQSDEVLERIG